jgi:hypothetical protein
METKKEQLEKELKKLAIENGYDSIRISLAPDKNISVEGVMEDMIALFKDIKTGEGITTIFTCE